MKLIHFHLNLTDRMSGFYDLNLAENKCEKSISMNDIYSIITHFNDDICCVFHDDNASNLIMRVEIKSDPDVIKNVMKNKISFIWWIHEKGILNKIILKGIVGINKASMSKSSKKAG